MQLEGDPQKEVAVERVVVCEKWTRVAASRDLLQHRSLDVDETALVQQTADRGDDPGPRPKHRTDLRVCDEIDVALAVPDLDVLEPVPLFGEWPERLRQELKRLDLERDLTPLGPKDRAGDADDVPGVQVREARELLLAKNAAVGHQLDPAVAVLQVGEDKPPLQPLHHEPARKRDRVAALSVA